MTKSKYQNDTRTLYVSLIFRGKELDPEEISTKLGLKPFWSFKLGERYEDGLRIRTHGFWMIRSSEIIESEELTSHINWLIDSLKPVKNQLLEICSNEEIDAEISCYWVMPSSHEVFTLSPESLIQLAEFGINVEFSIYSPNL